MWIATRTTTKPSVVTGPSTGKPLTAKEWASTEGLQANENDKDGATPLFLTHEAHEEGAKKVVSANDAQKHKKTPPPLVEQWIKAKTEELAKEFRISDLDLDWTLGTIAAREGRIDVLKWLKESGANTFAVADWMRAAAQSGQIDIIKWLKEQGAYINGVELVIAAARDGQVDTMKWLKEQGSNINIKDSGGHMLIQAATGGHIEAMKWLKEQGADVNAKNYEGHTPLSRARDKETTKWLLANGANKSLALEEWVKAQERFGVKTNDAQALIYVAAMRQGSVNVLEWLKEQGANVNAKENGGLGWTAMHYAAREGLVEAMQWLKEQGADVNAKDGQGWTPIFLAASSGDWSGMGHIDAVKWLKEQGADINAKDVQGRTPIFAVAATLFGAIDPNTNENTVSLDVMKWLKELGADINVRDQSGQTLMFVAAKEGHVEAMKWLKEQGADVNVKDNQGETPMFSAVSSHVRGIYRVRKINAMAWLKEQGLDVNAKSNNWIESPIFMAFDMFFNAADTDTTKWTVKWLVENGADINTKYRDGSTPMFWAANKGYVEIMTLLKERGADVNAKADDGQTPIFWAASGGQIDAMKWLKEHSADVNVKAKDGTTPLSVAKSEEAKKWLLDNGEQGQASIPGKMSNETRMFEEWAKTKGLRVDERTKGDGWTLMHFAVMEDRVDVLEWLKSQGVNIDSRDYSGRTSMLVAARDGHLEAVKWLKEQGADINAKDNNAQTPLSVARNDEIKRLLLTNVAQEKAPMSGKAPDKTLTVEEWVKAKDTRNDEKDGIDQILVHLAAMEGRVDVLEWLKEQGAEVNAKNKQGWTPMFLAALGGHLDAMEWLKEQGATVNVKDSAGWTPMFLAACAGHANTMKWLKEQGTLVNLRSNSGSTALSSASHDDAKKWLRANGAQATAVDKTRISYVPTKTGTPVNVAADASLALAWFAAAEGRVDVLEWLKECGTDINAKDDTGRTPMFAAASEGKFKVMEWLKAQGADINARDRSGETPMFVAASKGKLEAMKWLRSQGVNIDSNGSRYMVMAAEKGQVASLKWLKTQGVQVNSMHGTETPMAAAARKMIHSCPQNGQMLRDDPTPNGDVPVCQRVKRAVGNGKYFHWTPSIGHQPESAQHPLGSILAFGRQYSSHLSWPYHTRSTRACRLRVSSTGLEEIERNKQKRLWTHPEASDAIT